MQGGMKASFYIFDNEISNDLKTALKKCIITYQLVPSVQHRCNTAERAIHTFQNHFLPDLASLPVGFLISKQNRLIQKTLLTLNTPD